MQYNRPDLMYVAKRLYSYSDIPSAPAFQSINHLIRYLSRLPHRPITHPSVLDGTAIHELLQELSSCDLHYQNISNGLVDFTDGGEGRDPNGEHAIACIIFCSFGVSTNFVKRDRIQFGLVLVIWLRQRCERRRRPFT